MFLPILLGAVAGVSALIGVAGAADGISKNMEVSERAKKAEAKYNKVLEKFKLKSENITKYMDTIGKKELEALLEFKTYIEIIEKIHNRPEYKEINNGIKLPDVSLEDIKEYSLGAALFLSTSSSLSLGVLGGLAASGAVYSAVLSLGVASTGTAISTLTGVAATNAALAALGGGALAAGGGGMALGSAVLGASTFGVGLLIGGLIFSFTADSSISKVEEYEKEVDSSISKMNEAMEFYYLLEKKVKEFEILLDNYSALLSKYINELNKIVYIYGRTDYNKFKEEEKYNLKNSVIVSKFLYEIIGTKLVLGKEKETEMNKVNEEGINNLLEKSKEINNKRDLTIKN